MERMASAMARAGCGLPVEVLVWLPAPVKW